MENKKHFQVIFISSTIWRSSMTPCVASQHALGYLCCHWLGRGIAALCDIIKSQVFNHNRDFVKLAPHHQDLEKMKVGTSTSSKKGVQGSSALKDYSDLDNTHKHTHAHTHRHKHTLLKWIYFNIKHLNVKNNRIKGQPKALHELAWENNHFTSEKELEQDRAWTCVDLRSRRTTCVTRVWF